MFQTLDECKADWERAGNYGGKNERMERGNRWIPYYRYLAQQREEAGRDPHAEEVAAYLAGAGILHPKATVLDIGSGAGAYTMAFSAHCAQVTALDMDSASLALLKKQTARAGLSTVRCAEGFWETFETDEKFSVTFSAMCPVICNVEELLKMESMTTETCCLIAVTRGSYDLHRKTLMGLLEVKPSGMTTEALRYYEILYLMGRQPDVKNYTQHFEYEFSLKEACRRNEIYFEIFGIPTETSRPILRRYFEERSKDGFVHDETQLKTALISWKSRKGIL